MALGTFAGCSMQVTGAPCVSDSRCAGWVSARKLLWQQYSTRQGSKLWTKPADAPAINSSRAVAVKIDFIFERDLQKPT